MVPPLLVGSGVIAIVGVLLQNPADVEKMGVAKYNAECRKIVMRYSQQWEVRCACVCVRHG